MTSRAEVTSRYVKAYVKASKKDNGRVLDHVVSVTGWSRDNARRRLAAAARRSRDCRDELPGGDKTVTSAPRGSRRRE